MSPIVWVGLFVTVAAFLVAGITGWRTARYVGRHRAPGRPALRPQRAMWREWLATNDEYGDEPLDDIIRNNQRG